MLLSSLVSLCHHLGSADEQTTGWDYCLDAAGGNSVCKDPCAGCCKFLPSSVSQSDSHVLLTGREATHNVGALDVCSGFSFPNGGAVGSM